MDTKTKLRFVINALNEVTVSGKRNLDFLLGSIQSLEQIVAELDVKPNEKEGR